MEIEKQRGISVASSVMQMEYRNAIINLLDTPGHQDFSEDTYRVLTAVDSALMVIDAANGVEPQTRRLIDVCRARHTPLVTFINKMDREVKRPLDLMDEIETALGMSVVPFTWPVGMGKSFAGVIDIINHQMRLFKAGEDRVTEDSNTILALDDPSLKDRFGDAFKEALAEVDLVKNAMPAFDRNEFLAGRQSPVFFGSAINNFGVREILNTLVDLARAPGSRHAIQREVKPDEFTTACSQACPSRAIIFGDAADENWTVAKLAYDRRAYHVFEELNTFTAVVYLKKVNYPAPASPAQA